jgi:leucyl/phenylalanyl-tRNA--protein transferase
MGRMVDWRDEPLLWDDPHGLVYMGGDLSPGTLLNAYRHGIFPWFNEDDPLLWWSPDPRTIFEFDTIHFSRRLLRTVKQGKYQVTFNQQFAGVMTGCSDRDEGSWITVDMLEAYSELHRLGHAHSVESWLGRELVGGIYGVAIGGFFAAESMFHRATDAGMVAMVTLVEHLRSRGYQLLDTQMPTDHTRSLGAIDIPRYEYLRRLERAVALPVTFGVPSGILTNEGGTPTS